jgi:putative endonuclease
MNQRAHVGAYGEQLVCGYLQKQNFVILAKNFRKRNGEVDLIARKGTLIVFVEVKARTHNNVDSAEIITLSKQRKIAYAAASFMLEKISDLCVCRFDVALVALDMPKPIITYIADAFQAEEYA